MTTPNLGAGDLPRDVSTADQLGSALQALNSTKLKTRTSDRLPDVMTSTVGGGVTGPMRQVTDLLGQFIGSIADDAPGTPTLGSPDDLPSLVAGFLTNLVVDPLRKQLGPLFDLLAMLTGTSADDWTVNDLDSDLSTALTRISLQKLADSIGGVSAAGGIENGLADWLVQHQMKATTAASDVSAVEHGIINGWTKDSTTGTSAPVYQTMGYISARINVKGFTRVTVTSTNLVSIPVGITECIVVGIAAGQDGLPGTVQAVGAFTGGAGGSGGGHIAQAIDPTGLSAVHVTIGTNGAATVFRNGSSGGDTLLTVAAGGVGGVATQFGYSLSYSSAGGGGGGGGSAAGEANVPGARGGNANGPIGGRGGAVSGGGLDGVAFLNPAGGGRGGNSAAAAGGAWGEVASPGFAGGSVSSTAMITCGGGGGGGGGSNGATGGDAGRGGAGGFPGGGGGGGGGSPFTAGVGGAGAAGLALIFYR